MVEMGGIRSIQRSVVVVTAMDEIGEKISKLQRFSASATCPCATSLKSGEIEPKVK